MRYLILILVTASVVLVPTSNDAQAQLPKQPTQIDVLQLMSAAEFKGAGLDKLSSGELDALNQWLTSFAEHISRTTKGGSSGCGGVIESQIEGKFEGWSGETIFKLTNGQVWQQSSYDYTYHYAYRPQVMIFPSGGGCKMKVEGLSNSVPVKRLK